MNFLTDEDFPGICREFWFPEMLKIANEKIRAHVGPKVHGQRVWGIWKSDSDTLPDDDTEAHLFCVRKLALGELEGGE